MGRQRVAAFVLAVTLTAAVGCGDREESIDSADNVLAIINGRPLTGADIDARLAQMSPQAKQEFETPAMLSSMINREINVRVWAEAAREAGLQDTDEFREFMESAETTILAQLYSDKIETEGVEVSEEEIREVYERDNAKYAPELEVHARHILCTIESGAVQALEAVRGGMSFEEAVRLYSEDSATKDASGDLGTITRRTAIPGLGVAEEFFDALSEIEEGSVGGPIHSRRGFHIVQVLSKTQREGRPLSAVRPQIIRRLKKEHAERGLEETRAQLWKKFDVQVFNDSIKRYIGYPVTPADFMRHIQEATSSGDKITLCQEMLRLFPDNKYAPYAQFTLGFVYSEELRNYGEAERCFLTLVERYPDSDLVEAAKWMIENMAKPHPPLRNVDDVKSAAERSGG